MAKKKQVTDEKNKGEWGERYFFPKIIHEKKIKLADKDLNTHECSNFITITKLTTSNPPESFSLESDDRVTVTNEDKGEQREIDLSDTINENILKRIISKIQKETGTFEVSEFNSIYEKLGIGNIKGGTSYQKADIVLDIKDGDTEEKDVGFSIKSRFGKDPTLLNATGQTNFIYEVDGFPIESLNVVNEIKTRTKYQDRIKKIQELGGLFKYTGITSKTLLENLFTIDKNLHELISKMLLRFYVDREEMLNANLSKLKDSGKLDSFNNKKLQSLKAIVKKLLIAILFGMFPSKKWDGENEAEGLIVVKENGDLVCFYNKNLTALGDYLLENTYFETPSSKNAKTGKRVGNRKMAELYENDGKVYLNFGLQIRLKVG